MKTQTANGTKAAALLQGGGLPSYLALAGGGVVVGVFSGLFGVGGGILMVPFLLLVVGYTQQQAQGLSLTAMIVTALTGAIGYFKGGTVTPAMLPVAAALAVGSIPGAWAGSAIAQKLDKTQLSALFAIFIVLMAVRIMPPGGAKALHLPFSGVFASMLVLIGALVLGVGVRMLFAVHK